MLDTNALAFSLLTPQEQDAPKSYAVYSVGAEARQGIIIPPFLDAGGTLNDSTQIQDDADFVALTTTVYGQVIFAGGGVGYLPVLVDLEVGGRRLFDRPIPIMNFALSLGAFFGLIGPNTIQHRLPWPIRMPRSSLLKAAFQNLDTVNQYTFQLLFEGFVIYRPANEDTRKPT